LVVAGSSLAVLISASVASAACVARPMTVGQALKTGQTTIKLPPFLHATLVCSTVRGLRGAAGAKGVSGKAGAAGSDGGVGTTGLQGLLGLTGSTGLQGPTGSTGLTGPAGPAGPAGAPGAAGAAGTAGAPGTPGTPGTPGAPGSAATKGLAEYASVSNEAAQSVASGSNILFATNGVATSGITHVAASAEVHLTNAGVYRILFSASTLETNQISLMLNGVAVTGGTFGSGGSQPQTMGQTIINAAAGDILTLKNDTTGALTFPATIGGPATTENASIVIEKLG
jgi:hypothetical protein